MDLLSATTIFKVAFFLIALFILWTIVKGVLKFTFRLFAIGCLILGVLVAFGWIVGFFT